MPKYVLLSCCIFYLSRTSICPRRILQWRGYEGTDPGIFEKGVEPGDLGDGSPRNLKQNVTKKCTVFSRSPVEKYSLIGKGRAEKVFLYVHTIRKKSEVAQGDLNPSNFPLVTPF